MKAPTNSSIGRDIMESNRNPVERLREEFANFERTMEELHFLKLIAQDLKSFRRMLRFMKFD